MTLTELKNLVERLGSRGEELQRLRAAFQACQLSGHQKSISVQIDGVGSIALTEMDNAYAQRLIRGREIILLGVKKAIAAQIDAKVKTLRELEEEIASARVIP